MSHLHDEAPLVADQRPVEVADAATLHRARDGGILPQTVPLQDARARQLAHQQLRVKSPGMCQRGEVWGSSVQLRPCLRQQGCQRRNVEDDHQDSSRG